MLIDHPVVDRVLYPQLPDHPGHAAAAKQMTELNQAATMALGGKDPFITARDEAVKGLGTIEQRIQQMGQMPRCTSRRKVWSWCAKPEMRPG